MLSSKSILIDTKIWKKEILLFELIAGSTCQTHTQDIILDISKIKDILTTSQKIDIICGSYIFVDISNWPYIDPTMYNKFNGKDLMETIVSRGPVLEANVKRNDTRLCCICNLL